MSPDLAVEAARPRRTFEARRILATMCRQMGVRFVVAGEPEPAVGIFAPETLLPVVALHAELAARDALGMPLGVEFLRDERALLGVYSRVPAITGDGMGVMRACFLSQAARRVFGIRENVQIEVVPVIEHYYEGLLSDAGLETGSNLEKLKWPMAQVSPR